MGKTQVSKTKDCFERNGNRFLYLADTVWSAFTNATPEEWEEYLDYRRLQGFNALQINILPQWDRSLPDLGFRPFKLKPDGIMDFFTINEEYFKRAENMVAAAYKKGFIPALVVLWCDFVKDTWASKRAPDHLMPLDAVKPYVEYVVGIFSKYDPIYLVSGDTDFKSPETIKYYSAAFEAIKSSSPDTLTTLHMAGGLTDIPEEFISSQHLDFYMYQSGHMAENQHLSYAMAEDLLKKPVKRPIVNGEPCYEGHGYGGKYGRFNEFDVRKAIWQSLLSGSKAGVTYGAHGIWSWHRRESSFASSEFSSIPYDWKTALRFKGAWDAGFARWVFEKFDLFDVESCSMVLNETREIRAAVSNDSGKIVVYAPYSADIRLNKALVGYDWTLIELEDRNFTKPEIIAENELTIIKMHPFNSDVVIIGMK